MPIDYDGDGSAYSGLRPTAVTISEPVDADPPNAASVATPLETLADYATFLCNQSGLLHMAQTWLKTNTFGSNVANTNAIIATGNGTASGIAATGGVTNGPGVSGQGGGAGVGIYGTGGTNANGVRGIGNGTASGVAGFGGATNGIGVSGSGVGTGSGVYGVGDAAANANGVRGQGTGNASGVAGFGGPTNGIGVTGAGAGTGAGGYFANGTAATGATRQNALVLANGDVDMDAVASPNANVPLNNVLTNLSFAKAWASIKLNSTATPILQSGMNLSATPLAISASVLTVTLHASAPMISGGYPVLITLGGECGSDFHARLHATAAGSFAISLWDTAGVLVDMADAAVDDLTISAMVLGPQ